MRALAFVAMLILVAPAPEIRYFHFERPIQRPAQSAGQTCFVVTPDVFPHASAQLADLRLYQGATETPYVVRSDIPLASNDQTIALMNLGKSGNQTVFDAEMSEGHYSDVELNVSGHNFLATVTVSGSQSQTGTRTKLGSFTIFDLMSQRLGRSTILHLPESDFRFLHFQIAGPIAPDDVTGLSVTRMPVSQPKYVVVAGTSSSSIEDRNSVIEFVVSTHTPVDRVAIVPGQDPQSFSRDVQISVSPVAQAPRNDATEPTPSISAFGNILRVHSVQNGHRIDEEQLTVNAPQASFDSPTKWTITIENHDDAPIQLASVRLEMLQRDLCFAASAGGAYTLYYGDAALAAPVYDYATLFVLQQNPVAAQLGPETSNPSYQPRPDERPFTEKHPALLWVALVLVIGLLAAVAFRSFKAAPANPT
jgi:hypothetical protein